MPVYVPPKTRELIKTLKNGVSEFFLLSKLHTKGCRYNHHCHTSAPADQSGPISRSFPKMGPSKPGMHQNQHGQVSEKVIFGRPWYSYVFMKLVFHNHDRSIDLEGTKVALVWPADHSKTKKFVVYLRLARFSIVTS